MALILRPRKHHCAAWLSSTMMLLLLLSTQSFAADLLEYRLKELNGLEYHQLDQYRGNTVLMIFFQPECSFCIKQSKVLSQIQAECPDFQVIGVGVNGSRSDLQHELRAMRADYPAYEINSSLQAEVGKVEGTPLLLVADKQGRFTHHLQGYQQLDDLLPVLGLAGLSCK